jgi:hypothetical protein
MMEDKWKKIFNQNRAILQDEFPLPIGHEERFLAKLNEHRNTGKISRMNYWKVAAVLIPILMLSAYYFLELNPIKIQPETVELADYSKDLGEAENYLAYVVKEKTKEINQLKNKENKDLINHSLNELDSLQSNYNQLLKDLKESGGNPQVIKSVVMNLQFQVEVLESVMNQIQTNQQIKNNYDENTL